MLFGVLLLTGIVFLVLTGLRLSEGSLRQAELDRERGRVWAMTCGALHRAVQAGMVTGPSAVVPGPVVAPAAVTPAQLKQPPVPPPPAPPFPPFLPTGLAGVATAGATGLAARYGAVVETARGVPVAVCSLSGADLAARAGSLREGAAMGGLDLVGVVGGEDTPMHARLAAVQSLFGTLADGSLFATADFGIAHRTGRLHRRPVGGRPDLARMEQRVRFQGSGNIEDAGEVTAAEAESLRGAALGARVEVGSVVDASLLVLTNGSGAAVSAGQGFAFGGVQTVFSLPGELAVGTLLDAGELALESRGALSAGSMTLTGSLSADTGIAAVTRAQAGSLDVAGAIGGSSATIGTVTVRNPPCQGCVVPGL